MKKASAKSFDVVTIGAATRDVFVRSKALERKTSSAAPDGFDVCMHMGQKMDINELLIETGGGATNAAVTFRRMGLRTACVSRIGNDSGGKEVLTALKREHVDVRGIQADPKERTAYSIIFLSGTGHRAIFTARGAAKNLDGRDIPWPKLSSSWIYLTSLSGNEGLLEDVFQHVRHARGRIAWNPGNAEIHLGFKTLMPFLLRTDILLLNREEAGALCRISPRNLHEIMSDLGSLPRMAVVITDGAHGAYVHARGITWHAPALKAKLINTTGAGDAFGSAFVASLVKTGKFDAALRAGTLNAAGVVSHMGAKTGILKRFPSKPMLARVKVKESR